MSVATEEDFAETLQRKLVREIADRGGGLLPSRPAGPVCVAAALNQRG